MCNLFVYEGEDFWSVRHYKSHETGHEYVIWKTTGAPRALHKSYKRFYEPPVSSVPLPEKLDTLLRAFIALRGKSI